MKVILLKTDKKFGNENDIIEVSDSYARNVLIPKRVAEEATKDALNRRESRIAKKEYLRELSIKFANETLEDLHALGTLTLKMPCSPAGKMFGCVTTTLISKQLREKGIDVDKHKISVPPIKTFGKYTVNVKLFEDISTMFVIDVVAE